MKDSVQSELADDGIVKEVLEPMGDGPRFLHGGKLLNRLDRVLTFVKRKGRRGHAVHTGDTIPTAQLPFGNLSYEFIRATQFLSL